MFTDLEVTLKVDKYIADPYWPEREEVVNIEKRSGVNRARSDDSREKALRGFLETQNMTMEDLERLRLKANRPWYRVDNDDDKSPIMIPRHHLSGALVQACTTAPAGARMKKESLRSLVMLGDFLTTMTAASGVFKRFVKPTDGTGKALSNQRSLRVNPFIESFEAVGNVQLDESVKVDTFRLLLEYAGKYIGVGASRKMGYGRFRVKSIEVVA